MACYRLLAACSGTLLCCDVGVVLFQLNIAFAAFLKTHEEHPTNVAVPGVVVVTSLLLAIGVGYFLIDIYWMISHSLQPPPKMPKLEDLPGESHSTPEQDLLASMENENCRYHHTSDNLLENLITELRKLPLSTDRVELCRKFVRNIPSNTKVSESGVNHLLRFFNDIDDGFRILSLFEPHMEKKTTHVR